MWLNDAIGDNIGGAKAAARESSKVSILPP